MSFADFVDKVQPCDDNFCFAEADRDQARRIVCATLFVFQVFDEYFDVLANFEAVGFFVPLTAGNGTFTLEAQIDDHLVFIKTNDAALDDVSNVDALANAGFVFWKDQIINI